MPSPLPTHIPGGFYLYLISQNCVTWLSLASKEARKASLDSLETREKKRRLELCDKSKNQQCPFIVIFTLRFLLF